MAQHVRVDFHIEPGRLAGALQHRLKAAFRERRPALADKDERRFGAFAP
jgi:hypothetical protein